MNQFDAVLFDLDGTLLDTARDLGNALNHVLSHLDLPLVGYEQYRNIASDGAKGLLQLGLADKFEHYDFEFVRTMLLDFYQNHICVDTKPFTGVNDILNELNKRAIPWGIVTNKPAFLTDVLLTHFPLMQQCGVVVSGDTLLKRKPDPLPLTYAANKLKVNCANTLYVGDALRDIQAAKAAGMPSAVADYGYIDGTINSKAWQANYHLQNPLDLLYL